MIYIRADGNTAIGMGHVMRCLSIAEAAADLGKKPVFITADEGCRSMIEDRGFETVVLDTDYRDMLSELPMLKSILNDKNDMILVDSYQVSEEYYRELGRLSQVACLEDMGYSYPVDLLINYNIYAKGLKEQYKDSKRVLLGVEYMPLRKAFQVPCDYEIKDKITDVIITTGGSDPYFASDAFMEKFINDTFLSEHDIKWHIISGPFNSFADKLKDKYGKNENILIHENVKNMRELLLEGDVVISATGSTIYEISALGIPMIVFYFAPNQKQGAQALEKLTDIVNTGCFADNSRDVTDKALAALKKCIQDKSYRQKLYKQEKELIDGKGAERIAAALIRRNVCLNEIKDN